MVTFLTNWINYTKQTNIFIRSEDFLCNLTLSKKVILTSSSLSVWLLHIPTCGNFFLPFDDVGLLLHMQGVSKGQVNPYDGDSGPYLEQKILIHFLRIRPCF